MSSEPDSPVFRLLLTYQWVYHLGQWTDGPLPSGLLSASWSILHGAKAMLDPVGSGPGTSGLEGQGLP